MADAPTSIFNKRATEKLRNPDDLDKYLRVTNPSVWVVLVACIALLIGLLSWGVFGSVSTNVSTLGVVAKGQAMCFMSAEDVARVELGDVANFGGTTLRVSEVAAVPSSEFEVWELIESDYLVSVFVPDEWAYKVTFEGDISNLDELVPVSVSITTERVAPISLILGGNA